MSLGAPQSHYLSVNGIDLHYLEWPGEGRPIVLWHGTSLCAAVWTPMASLLSPTHRVLAVDMRGHGLSSKPPQGYGWDALALDHAAFMEALDIQEAITVGHSRGGMVVALGNARCSRRVAAAVLIEPSLAATHPDEQRAAGIRRKQARFATREELYQAYRQRDTFHSWSEEAFQGFLEGGTQRAPDGSVMLNCPPEVEAQFYADTVDPWTAVSQMTYPVLLLLGRQSHLGYIGSPLVERFLATAPRAQQIVVVKAGHFVPMERPAEIARRILGFAVRVGVA